MGEVNFWRDYLGESKARIDVPFGSAEQTLVVSTNLLSCEVKWPGIPAEYAKPFKNVEYVDDRSAWDELPDEVDDEGVAEEDDEALDENARTVEGSE